MDYKCPKCGHLFENVEYQPGFKCWFCGHYNEEETEAVVFEIAISNADVAKAGYEPDTIELAKIVKLFEQIFQDDYFFTIMKRAVNEWSWQNTVEKFPEGP